MLVTCVECGSKLSHKAWVCRNCGYRGDSARGFRHAGFCSVEINESLMGRMDVRCPDCKSGRIRIARQRRDPIYDYRGKREAPAFITYTGICDSCKRVAFNFEYSWGKLNVS